MKTKKVLLICILLSISISFFAANTFIRWGSTGDPLNGLTLTWKNTGTTDQIKWGYTNAYEKGSFTAVKRTAYTGNFFDYQFPTVTPNSTIHYQIYDSSTSTWSSDLTYLTSNTDPSSNQFSFLALGDSRTNMTVWNQVANLAAKKKSDFTLFTGDVTANSGTGTNWDSWFSSGTSVISKQVFYHCEGNHDSNVNGNEAVFLSQFIMPSNKQYYSFNYGNAVIIVLNSEVPTDATQLAWVKTTLAANVDKTWKIVMFHKPFFTIGTHAADMNSYRTTWWKAFDDYGVDIIFNGHDHMYERTKPINLNVNASAPVTKYGSGATEGRCQVVCGGAGAPLYTGTPTNMIDKYSSTYNFCKIDVKGTVLVDSTWDSSGNFIETFKLDKTVSENQEFVQKFNTISVSPNPNNGNFDLKYKSDNTGTAQLRVYDMLGKKVSTNTTTKDMEELNYKLNLKKCKKGLYNLQVQVGNQKDNILFFVN